MRVCLRCVRIPVDVAVAERRHAGRRTEGRSWRARRRRAVELGDQSCTYETSDWACRETESGAGNGPGEWSQLYISTKCVQYSYIIYMHGYMYLYDR